MLKNIRSKTYNLLRWSEQYTKTDMVYLAKGGFWLAAGQLAAMAMTFILAVAFANLLPKETYGLYKYVLSMAGLLSIFSLTGMNTAVTQAVARGFEGALKKSFWVQIKWSFLMFFVSLAVSIYYFVNSNQVLGFSFLIIGSFSPLLNSANTYTAFLGGLKKFKELTQYGAFSSLFSGSLILLALLLTKNPIILVLVYFLANTATIVFFYLRTLRVFKPNKSQDPETISYGKNLSLMNVISLAAFYLDGPLIFHFLGTASLAIYAMAIAPAEQIKGLFKIVASLALPKLSERSSKEIQQNLNHKIIVSMVSIFFIVLFYVLFAPLIYKTFFPKYLDSVFFSQLYSISIIAVAVLIPSATLQSQLAKKELYIYNISSSVIQVLLLIPFVIFMGLLGAIIARILSRFINLAISIILVKKMGPA